MRYRLLLILLVFCFRLTSIEVGGHITANTTWSPENNPYIVIHNIYVDSGVDLTILPGTIIKFLTAPMSYSNLNDFTIQNEDSVAKMMFINGRIIAVGTEQDSITFTRNVENPDNMRWGNIVFSEQAPKSMFKHCKIMFTEEIHAPTTNYKGGLCCRNGQLDISYCRFVDNRISIWIDEIHEPLLIAYNVFQQYHCYPEDWFPTGFWTVSPNYGAEIILAYNQFFGIGAPFCFDPPILRSYPTTKLFNSLLFASVNNYRPTRTVTEGDAFGNLIAYNNYGVGASTIGEDSKAYIRRNTLINAGGISAYGNVEISDNVLTDCNHIEAQEESNIDIFNNRLKNTIIEHNGEGKIYNNIVTDFGYNGAYCISPGVTYLRNNIAYNGTGYPVYFSTLPMRTIIDNNIFWNVHVLNLYPFTEATFRNNCMSIPLPDQCIDGGGNIIGSNPLFADPDNGDFHLLAGSPCIDAGFDTTGYALFDNEYYHRVVDGDNDGNAVIDIGALEYGSSFQGGFEGHIYYNNGTEPLSLVRVDIEGVTREYTDSLGYFRFSAPEGTYNLRAHHIFEGDRTFTVHINDGEMTYTDFLWNPPEYDEDTVIPVNIFNLHNYPNPFNPSTTISFTLPKDTESTLKIYNTKGQMVRTLVSGNQKAGKHDIVWNSTDDVGKPVSSGVYLYRLESGKHILQKKMILMK